MGCTFSIGAARVFRDKRSACRLSRALARYRSIASRAGWKTIPGGSKLEHGMHSPWVAALRDRLIETDDLRRNSVSEESLFDDAVGTAVTVFRRRRKLETDGVVGAATLAALNAPVEARITQMELNLER